jgi:tight adherence protein B
VGVTGLVVALCAALGTFYLYTAVVLSWRGLGVAPAAARTLGRRRRVAEWMAQAGLGEVDPRELVGVTAALVAVGVVAGLAVFGGALPALVLGACLGTAPLASYRVRRLRRRSAAQEAWPRIIEEVRILTSSLGRSVPQAVFEAGRSAPESLRPAFAAAEREWLLSTDFERTIAVLKADLADPTADAAAETLLVAHEVGGTDLDRRLDALIEDRVIDVQGRKDARSRQAGIRLVNPCVSVGRHEHANAGGWVRPDQQGRHPRRPWRRPPDRGHRGGLRP